MAGTHLPGPLGSGSRSHPPPRGMGTGVQPGPLGLDVEEHWRPPLLLPEDHWHPPLLPRANHSEAELMQGVRELELLREGYGNVLDRDGNVAYAVLGQAGWSYRADEYLTHRDTFFGSSIAYEAYLAKARAELQASSGKLRKAIVVHGKPPRWEEAQDVFYAWTRRAYENVLGSAADIPALISANASEKLRIALRQVEADFGGRFRRQAMSARPMKTPRGYRLGTLSDHALGEAVDIQPETNPQIEAEQWKAILAFTGKSLDQATRKRKWTTAPQELHRAIVEINELFVSKLAEAVAAHEAAADTDALAAVVKADPHLRKIGLAFVRSHQKGFFDLEWALVKELHEEKFSWGAIFSRVDLHHFEL